MDFVYRIRRKIGYVSIISGILSGLSAFLVIPFNIGLCSDNDIDYGHACLKFYERIGFSLFFIFFIVFVLGSLFFTLSKSEHHKLRLISLLLMLFAIVFYVVVPGDSGWWSLSLRALIGWPLIVMYGAVILGMEFKELFEPLTKKFSLKKIVVVMVVLTFIIFWIIAGWL